MYDINSTLSSDIIAAVRIAAEWYHISPEAFMRNIYVKNLNVENEQQHRNSPGALVQANQNLYTGVGLAIKEAAIALGVSGDIDFWVMSNNVNPKIPRADLHQALRDSGAKTGVGKRRYQYRSGSNDGTGERMLITHLHLAINPVRVYI